MPVSHCFLHREIDDEKLLMKISIEIDKDTLFSGVEYKYAVLHSKDKCAYEFVPRKVTTGHVANRSLSVPKERIQQLTGK